MFEAKLYNYLHGSSDASGGSASSSNEKGIPRVYFSGTDLGYNIMAMDLLGDSLEELFNKSGRKFSLKTVLMLADQMLSRIEFMHSRHFLHRDIKPDNFLMGSGKRNNNNASKDPNNTSLPANNTNNYTSSSKVYLIDLGLAKRFIDKAGKHIPYKENKSLTGTARYASVNTHVGIE